MKAGTTSAQLTSLTDVMATVAAIIGAKLPDTAPDAPGQLYNLETDPVETTILYFKHPEIVKELKALLEQSKATGRGNKLPTTKRETP